MAYAEDKLYNDVIRKMMGNLASKVRVREIIAFLPCLTISDREEIEAKRETAGNYCAMMVLLDNLRRREKWPDHFIKALRTCEQEAFANEISEAYDNIRGINTWMTAPSAALDPVPPAAPPAAPPAPAPAPAPAHTAAAPTPAPSEASSTVTTVTIYRPPHFTPPLLTPSVDGPAQKASPSTINPTPGPNSNKGAPALTETPTLVSAPDVPVYASTETSHLTAFTLTPSIEQSGVAVGQRETSKVNDEISAKPVPINSLQKPCSNASPVLTAPPSIVSPQEVSKQSHCELAQPVDPPVLVLAPPVRPPSPVFAPKVTPPVGQSKEPADLTAVSGLSSVAAPTLPTNQTTTSSRVNKSTTISQPSASPEKSTFPAAATDSTSSVKNPVQDTNPPGTVLDQDSQNNPAISQVVKRAQTTVAQICQPQETSQVIPTASADAIAGCMSNVTTECEENFSKPGILTGEEPFSVGSDLPQISNVATDRLPFQPAGLQTVLNPHRAQEPVEVLVSLTSDDLMISSSTTSVPSQIVTDPIVPVRHDSPVTLKNSFAEGDNNSYPNQPVEDHYESVCQSLQAEPQIGRHIVKVSEGPSVQNLSGQSPSIVRPLTKGESESLVKSVSEDKPSQYSSQSIQRNNATFTLAAGLAPNTTRVKASFQESELNASGLVTIVQSEQREDSSGMLHRLQSNWHLIAAAAIGMTAVFLALKFKH